MNTLKRKEFLKRMALLGVALLVLPRLGKAGSIPTVKAPVPPSADDPFVMQDGAVIDLHCHPGQKMWLLHKKMWKKHHAIPGPNMFSMQESLEQYTFGTVKGFLATHYLVEASAEQSWDLFKKNWKFFSWLFPSFVSRLEQETDENFKQINEMMDMMENQFEVCNKKKNGFQFFHAKTFADFESALDPAKKLIPYAHSMEGAHGLGRLFPISAKRQKEQIGHLEEFRKTLLDEDKIKERAKTLTDRIDVLITRGLCLITLAHFFRNDIAYPVDGMDPDSKNMVEMAWEFTPDQDRGLTKIGHIVVRYMLDKGVIVDLTHSDPGVRADVFTLNHQVTLERKAEGKEARPLVFTHTGAQAIYAEYDQGHYPYYKYYSVSDEEIALIEECDGVIGVIPENFWLTGGDTHMKNIYPPQQFQNGIFYMLQTMKYINSKTAKKNYRHVGIGTDFDGLADNPADLYCNQQLAGLVTAMKGDPELTHHVDKIMSENALRLLRKGWGV